MYVGAGWEYLVCLKKFSDGAAKILMPPKHQNECTLERPNQKTYFENQFGAKSIGEAEWKPHIRNVFDYPDGQEHSSKGGNGLDWFSSIRCPEPHNPENDRQLTIERKELSLTEEHVQPLVKKKKQSSRRGREKEEDSGRIYERSLEQRMGRRKKVQDVRNGINERAPGDKSYNAAEYEKGFHNLGSTLPVVNFGGSLKTVPDTFIPLMKLPLQPRISFHAKDKKKEKAKEINEVKQLDLWKPAELLSAFHS